MENKNNPYTSTELYHFVGHASPENHTENFNKLLMILSSKRVSHWPHDNNGTEMKHSVSMDGHLLDESLVDPAITCYAYIPFSSLGIHSEKYGCFGLSFHRNFLSRYGARPVMYVPIAEDDRQAIYGSSLLKNIEATYKGFYSNVVSQLTAGSGNIARNYTSKPQSHDEAIHVLHSVFVKDFLAFIKPFRLDLPEKHADNFYMEREWRKYGNLEFNLEDIQKITVFRGFRTRLEDKFPYLSEKIVEIPSPPESSNP